MPHDSRAVANYFLTKAKDAGKQLTPMQIIKLVYFAHGWSLGLLRSPLIDDQIEAWDYGPVIRPVYDAFKQFGNQPITDPACEINWFDDDAEEGKPIESVFSAEESRLLDKVWATYGSLKGFQLSELTHREGSPWAKAFVKGQRNTTVPDEIIAEHFRAEAAQNRVRRGQAAAAE